MSDMDTSRFDGAPCVICGDDAKYVETVAEGSRLVDRAICTPCADRELTPCVACQYLVWVRDCTRIGRELYCEGCSATHPVIVGATMAAILADEADEAEYAQPMNQVRR